jgi:soluble lytic murein transglycosylase-like protein
MKKMLDKPYKTRIAIMMVLIFNLVVMRADYNYSKISTPKQETPKAEVKIVISKEEQQESLPKVQPKKVVALSRGGGVPQVKLTQKDAINNYVREIAAKYKIEPELIMSIIQQESEYNPRATTGNCLGLMQVSSRWHKERASKLGITNFYDPYGNILLGVDYMSELLNKYKDPRLALMVYNMNQKTAIDMYKKGKISSYAKTVLDRAQKYKKGE